MQAQKEHTSTVNDLMALFATSTSSEDSAVDADDEDQDRDMRALILPQLVRVNKCLDHVERRMEGKRTKRAGQAGHLQKLSNNSVLNKQKYKSKQ